MVLKKSYDLDFKKSYFEIVNVMFCVNSEIPPNYSPQLSQFALFKAITIFLKKMSKKFCVPFVENLYKKILHANMRHSYRSTDRATECYRLNHRTLFQRVSAALRSLTEDFQK